MFWNAKKKKSDKEFQEWKLQEKLTRVTNSYQEAAKVHERIKNRLFSVLSLSTTLCSASLAGAFTKQSYATICGGMSIGFAAVIGTCILGLRPRQTKTINIGPDTIESIMASPPAAQTREEGVRRMTLYIDGASLENFKTASKDRRYLIAAWRLLFATPIAATLATLLWKWAPVSYRWASRIW
ncbi:hypothetical protein [Saccharibacter floricola]|nr:hypothetical protein [Saccharibacter floricola]